MFDRSRPTFYRGASMHRFTIHVLTAAAVTFAMEAATAHAEAPRPNIIFIDSDDVGLGDIHFSGVTSRRRISTR